MTAGSIEKTFDAMLVELQELNDEIYILTKATNKEFSQLKDYETYRRRLSELLTLIMSRDK